MANLVFRGLNAHLGQLQTAPFHYGTMIFAHYAPLVLRRFKKWSIEAEPEHKYKPAVEIIRESEIESVLESSKERASDVKCVRDILQKARENAFLTQNTANDSEPMSEFIQGLNLQETATLLNIPTGSKMTKQSESLLNELYETAFEIKQRIYGNRIVLFAPLYLANYCVNQCTYCSFRSSNKLQCRSALSQNQLIAEVKALQELGHRRLLLVAGESPKYSFDQVLSAITLTASISSPPCGRIRRINVEIPSLSVSDFRRLKQTNSVGTYTLFQETYHRETFRKVHVSGPKSDYDHRLLTMDRAQIGGIDDVGIGALFGLADYRFEVLAMLQHALHLESTYRAGPHTISIPRIQPAVGAPDSVGGGPNPVSDQDFKKLVAVIRLSVPYTGMILSTREAPSMRNELLHLGVSQMSAGSKTTINSYSGGNQEEMENEDKRVRDGSQDEWVSDYGQFSLQDNRSVDEIVYELMKDGFVPSWCTACYRKGRTGEKFMKIAKRGNIHNYCHPNGLLTLQEYLMDYATPNTKELGEQVLEKEKNTITSQSAKNVYAKKLKRIQQGEHDLYF